MNLQQFIESVVRLARAAGFKVEINTLDKIQIDFGNKALHAGHLEAMFPEVLTPGTNMRLLIDHVAPGRPCTHRPMRQIVQQILTEN